MEDHMREQLKKSLEQKHFENSQSSTLDLGQSISRSKMSMAKERQSKEKYLGSALKLGEPRDSAVLVQNSRNKHLIRQRTIGSTSLSPTDRANSRDANLGESGLKKGRKGVSETADHLIFAS